MGAAYFDQFKIVDSIALTNSSMMMILAAGLAFVLLKGGNLIPSGGQIGINILYDHFHGAVRDNLGQKGIKFFPFILSLFFFIVFINVLGLFPYVFTATVHVVVTLGLSFSIVIGVTLAGVWNFQWNFLSIWMPAGAPLVLAPFLVLIETASFIFRAISLGVRLAANLSAGHLLFAILAGFGLNMVLTAGVLNIFPVVIMVFISLLEAAVAVIQAYVFSLLTIIYLSDAVTLH